MSTNPTPQPAIETRREQPYVGIRRRVTMRTIPGIADRIPEVFAWLAARGIPPAGAPFLKYDVIDMEGHLEVVAGVPVATRPDADGGVFADTLPGGRYATVTHVGHYDGLVEATGALLAWAQRQGLAWDMAETDGGQRWGCRIEIYRINPAEEPDASRWETQLAFRLA